MEFDQSSPIFAQIAAVIKRRVVSGEWPPGTKVASVRELAVHFGVNPNTMQRALAELEREGVLAAERTSGRYVTNDEALIGTLRLNMAKAEAARYLSIMRHMGFTKEQAADLINTCEEDEVDT